MLLSVLLALTTQLACGARVDEAVFSQVSDAEDFGVATPLSLAEIESRLKNTVFSSAGVASMSSLGETAHHGNTIWAVRITGAGVTPSGGKKFLFTFNLVPAATSGDDAGVYVVEQMIQKARADAAWLQDTEVVIVPVANPDGFAFRQQGESFWSKNHPSPGRCSGVNLNRNFKGWQSSSSKCSPTYSGSSALSEKESQALAAEIKGSFVHINVMGNHDRAVTVGYACKNGTKNFELARVMTRAITKQKHNRHRTRIAQSKKQFCQGLSILPRTWLCEWEWRHSSQGVLDAEVSQGVLAAEVRTSSKEECLAGLLAAISPNNKKW